MISGMRLEQTWTSDNSVTAAYGAHLDQWVREEGCRQAGAIDFTVTITDDGDATKVVLDRQVPMKGLPGPALKVIGDKVRIVQTERWFAPDSEDVSRADITVEFPGKPIAMTAEAGITPTDTGSTEVVAGEVKVKVPMVGRVIEPEVVKQIVRSLKIEMQVGLDWLAEGNG
jgi:hypothetical protein